MIDSNRHLVFLGLTALCVLTACGRSGSKADPNGPGQQNSAPAVYGSPPATATAGVPYAFLPTATDADGDAITWGIWGKPSWAAFNPATGAFNGTPTSAGSFSMTITASDGQDSTSIGPFTISVAAAPGAMGTAALSWVAPAQYTDGSSLNPATELAGYSIYEGNAPGSLDKVADVDAGATGYTMQGLSQGTHYFAVTAITSNAESEYSMVVSKTIP